MGVGTSIPVRGRTRAPLIAAVLGAATLIGIGAGALVHALQPGASIGRVAATRTQRPNGGLDGQATWAARVRPAPAITALRDQSGRRFALSSLHGRPVAIAFFDSHCNQECPLEGRALATAERSVPARDRPVLVAVSVNPRDTPGSVRRAAAAWGLAHAGAWHWLMGSRAGLAPVWHAYRIFVGRALHGDIPHTEALYLVGRSGYERAGYLYPFMPRSVAHDMRALGRPSTGSSRG